MITMNRFLRFLVTITTCGSLSAQVVDSLSHKQRMIEAINSGNFDQAAAELPLVENWSFKKDSIKIDISKGLEVFKYVDSMRTESSIIDSLSLYIAAEAEDICMNYYDQEKYDEAIIAIEFAKNLREKTLGALHPEYAYTLNQIGLIYYDKGDYDLAERYLQEALQIRLQALGENHQDCAKSYYYLGMLCYENEDYINAEKCYLQAAQIYKISAKRQDADYAKTLYDLAGTYQKLHDFNNTERYLLQSLEMYKSIYGGSHAKVLHVIQVLGRVYYENGNYTKAIKCCQESLKIQKHKTGENNADYARMLCDLGSVYWQLGDFGKSETCYLHAAEIRKGIVGINHPDYISSLMGLGILCSKKGDYTKAEEYQLEALRICESLLGVNNSTYASLLNNLGALYGEMYNDAKAEMYYLRSIQIRKDVLGENNPQYARSLCNIGFLYYRTGNYAKSEAFQLQALEIRKKTLGEDHPDYAYSLNNIGILYSAIGDYAIAEQYYLQALKIRKHTLGESHPDYASSLTNIGNLYYRKGDYIKAEKFHMQALEVYKNIFGENHDYYAMSLCNIGNCYYKNGYYAKAEESYLHSLRIRGKALGKNNSAYAMSLCNLGELYAVMGIYDKAKQYSAQAQKIRKKVLGESHPDYIMSLNNLGVLYSKVGEYSKAWKYFTKERMIEENNYLCSLDFMSEHQRESYWSTMKINYEETFPLFTYRYYSQKPSISTFAYDNELFVKGLLLNSSEAVRRSITENGDTTLIRQWEELTTLKQQIIIWEEKDPQASYLEELHTRAEKLEKQVTASSAAFRENQAQWSITWDSVRNHLNNNQVAIEYMVAPLNEDSTMYCALLLRNKSKYPELIPLFEENQVRALVSDNVDSTYSYKENGNALAGLVWSQVLPYIKQGEIIYFAPSGLLHQVAIEALPYDSTHTMGDVYNLVRVSSTREIVLNKNANQHSTATLYGGIQYNADAEELLAESVQYATSHLLASRGIENDTLNRGGVNYLPGTKKEVEHVNKMLAENNLHTQLYTSTSANEESFKALSGTHQNILHIATHGFYWSDSTAQQKDYFSQRSLHMSGEGPIQKTIDPLNRCGLLMAGANIALSGHSADLPEGVQDGILTAKEISLLDLRDANLVVLSACETGKGDITGEGVFGLQRAFKQAGAQTIIMSLWPVNDAATQLLMTEFYRNWITNHQSKREAFRNAQNTVRSKYPEPAYWAGFIMLD